MNMISFAVRKSTPSTNLLRIAALLTGLFLVPALALGQTFVQVNSNPARGYCPDRDRNLYDGRNGRQSERRRSRLERYDFFSSIGDGRQHQHLQTGGNHGGSRVVAGDLLRPEHRYAHTPLPP